MQAEHDRAQDQRDQDGKRFRLIIMRAEHEGYFRAARSPRLPVRTGENAKLVLARRNVGVVSRSMIFWLAPIFVEPIQPVAELYLLRRDEARSGKAESQFPGARRDGKRTIRIPLLVIDGNAFQQHVQRNRARGYVLWIQNRNT